MKDVSKKEKKKNSFDQEKRKENALFWSLMGYFLENIFSSVGVSAPNYRRLILGVSSSPQPPEGSQYFKVQQKAVYFSVKKGQKDQKTCIREPMLQV